MTTVTSKHLKGLYHRLTVTLSAAEVEEGISQQGPTIIVDDGSNNDGWQQGLEKFREQAYQEALTQTTLRVVSEPEFAWVSAQPGADCVFTATVEVMPTVNISGLDELVIETPDTEVSDDDVTHALEVLRDEHKTFESVERPAQVGDRVIFDYTGTIDGEAFKGSAVEGATAVIGAGDTLDEMDAALVGCSAGKVFTIPITFPDEYAEPDLRGKSAQFNIVVQTVAEPHLPALEPDFIKKLGIDSGSLDELRDQLRDNLKFECKLAQQRYERRQLSQALLDAVPVTVPDALLRAEVERIRQTFEQKSATGEATAEPMPDAPLEATAKRRLELTLILSELMRQRKVKLDEEKVEKKLDELAARYGDVELVKSRYRDDEQLMQNVRALVMEEAGFEAAFEMAGKTPVAMSFDELLRADQEEH